VNATRASARTLARLERKRAQAEAMGEKQRAQETGEDLERKTNWEYSIEDNEKWDKKQKRKESRAQFAFTGATFFSSLLSYCLPMLTPFLSRRLRRRRSTKVQEGMPLPFLALPSLAHSSPSRRTSTTSNPTSPLTPLNAPPLSNPTLSSLPPRVVLSFRRTTPAYTAMPTRSFTPTISRQKTRSTE
jgi:hypothetical protein